MKSMICEVVAEDRNGQQTAWIIRAKVGAKRPRIGQWGTPGFQAKCTRFESRPKSIPDPYPIRSPEKPRRPPAIRGSRAQRVEQKPKQSAIVIDCHNVFKRFRIPRGGRRDRLAGPPLWDDWLGRPARMDPNRVSKLMVFIQIHMGILKSIPQVS